MLKPNPARIIPVLCLALMSLLAGCGGRSSDVQDALDRGRAALSESDLVRAREAFEAAVADAPADIEARLALGEVMERQQEQQAALDQYAAVLAESPDNLDALRRAAQLQLGRGNEEASTQLVEKVRARAPDTADTLALEAAYALANGELEVAKDSAERALAASPGHVNASVLLASIHFRAERPDEADAVLEAALEAHPKDTALRALLTRIYREQGRSKAQQAQLEALVELEPKALAPKVQLALLLEQREMKKEAQAVLEDGVKTIVPPHSAAVPAQLALIDFLRRNEGVDAATARFQEFIEAAPENPTLRMGLARFHEQNGQLAQARHAWERVLSANPPPPRELKLEARTRMAATLALLGDRETAAKELTAVLEESPDYPEARMLRGTLALDEGATPAAIEDFEAILAQDPSNARANRALARALLADDKAARAEEVLEKAIEAAPRALDLRAELASVRTVRRDLDGAIAALEGILEIAPTNAGALEAMYRVRMFEQDWGAAHAVAARIKTTLPESPLGFHLDGLTYQAEGKPADSLPQFESALALAPDAIQPLTQAIRSHLALGKRAQAEKRLSEALEQNPENFVALNLLGELKLADKQYAAAASTFTKAIALKPDLDIFYRNLAAAELALKKEGAALATLRRGIDATGGSALLVTALANHYERTGRLDEAIAEYEAVLQDSPESDLALNNLAMLLTEYRGDESSLQRARGLLGRIRARSNPAYQDTLGWVMYRSGETSAAVETLRKAAAQMPDTPIAQYHLGMALAASGNAVEAKAALSRALEGTQDFRGREDAERTLKKLK